MNNQPMTNTLLSDDQQATFRLTQLVLPLLPSWLLAWGLGLITVFSVVGLLMASGWFISMAGLSGLIMVGSSSFNYFAPSAIIRTFAISRTAGRYGDLIVSHQTIFELLKRLRVRFFDEFSRLDSHHRSHLGSSVAQHRLVKDIDTLDEFVLRVISPTLIGAVCLLAFMIVLAVFVGSPFIMIALVVFVVAAVLVRISIQLAYQEGKLKEERQVSLLNALPALTSLLLWDKWQAQTDKLASLDYQLLILNKQAHHYKRLGVLMVQWLLSLLALAVLWLCASQSMNVAYLLALVLGVFGMIEIVLPLVSEPLSLGRSQLAKERLNALLAKPSTPKTTVPTSNFDIIIHKLNAKQTGAIFGIYQLNAHIKQGTPTVIRGVSGGGKSTLLDVLAGEVLPLSGQITLQADTPLPLEQVDWQGKLGYLGQKVDIFDQSLKDNLKLGKPTASNDELWQALDDVNLKEWAKAQPKGLDTPLGEYGTAISGGQARRIALARLLLSPKSVLLLDEPFAGLDTTTRHSLWQKLKARQQQAILVVVSHHDDIIDNTVNVLTLKDPVALV